MVRQRTARNCGLVKLRKQQKNNGVVMKACSKIQDRVPEEGAREKSQEKRGSVWVQTDVFTV